MKRWMVGGVAAVAFLGCAAISQTEGGRLIFSSVSSARVQGPAIATRDDTQFVTAALTIATTQIALAKLAQQTSANEDLRQLARDVAAEHGAATERLVEIAPRTAPVAVQAGGFPEERLAATRGIAFNRAYLDLAVQEQQRILALCESQARGKAASEVATLAASRAPELRRHLQLMHQMAAVAAASQPTAGAKAIARGGATPAFQPVTASQPPSAPISSDTGDLNRRELRRLGVVAPASR